MMPSSVLPKGGAPNRRRVAIIGGGAAGLASAKVLREDGHSVTVFERNDDLGGIWKFEENVEDDPLGINPEQRVSSSLYHSLRTNLPREVMAFSDFEFSSEYDSEGRRYPHHTAVLKYLRAYAQHFGLRDLMKFKRSVVSIKPKLTAEELRAEQQRSGGSKFQQPRCQGARWCVATRETEGPGGSTTGSRQVESEEFDCVMVCNGHNSVPYVPQVPGLEGFRGLKMHAHNYREPTGFRGLRVLIVGAAQSGQDISREIALEASKVWVSVKCKGVMLTERYGVRSNIVQVPVVQRIEGPTILLRGGQVLDVDSIVFCTGYQYTYPFLDSEVLEVHDNFVFPLYRQLLSVKDPTVALIGIPGSTIPFPQFEIQARYVSRVWSGHIRLPSTEQMIKELQLEIDDKRGRGIETKHWRMQEADEQFDYNRNLSVLSGFPSLPSWRRAMYLAAVFNRTKFPAEFRDMPLPTVEEFENLHCSAPLVRSKL